MDGALELSEAITVGAAGTIRPDGLVPLHIIRPGVGRGKGRHLYEARMLEDAVAQGRFRGWKMYVDHQSTEAKRASGGLPRSVRDLGGIIKEAWWDPSVPADPERGWGQGAVVGLAKPTRLIASLIEDDPELVEASISATATSVKPVQRGRDTVWLVEGIRPRGSVDWVTEAGAGGRVAPLIEALVEAGNFQEEEDMLGEVDLREDDDALVEYLVAERPDLLERLVEASDDGDGADDEAGELEQLVKKLMPKFKGNRKMAEMAAKRQLARTQEGRNQGGKPVPEGDLLEALQEALSSDEIQQAIDQTVRESIARNVAPLLGELIEAAMEDNADLLRAEGRAEAERMLEVRDMREDAHRLITESRLPEAFQAELRERYDLIDGTPTPALDVLAEENDEGELVRSARAVLREAVEKDIERKREQAASLRPTRVRGQGESSQVAEGAEGDGKKKVEESSKTTGSFKTDHLLQEAGIDPSAGIYDGILG